MKTIQKQVHPIFIDRDVVEAVRRLADVNKRTLKAQAEVLLRDAIERESAAKAKP